VITYTLLAQVVNARGGWCIHLMCPSGISILGQPFETREQAEAAIRMVNDYRLATDHVRPA
jgi:hypothetical protein